MNKLNITDNSVINLMAPTACGKTALAYELYDIGRYELISVDSALIYKDMNIGTAKPTAEELQQYPHHLVDIIAPTESYSVADFVQTVDVLIGEIHNRGKIPLLVGGTMMYYMALFDGLSNVPDSDPAMRAEVEAWRQAEGITALHDFLTQVDKPIADRLNHTDTQRITRAVEVYKQTGKPMSYWQAQPKQALAHNPNQNWIGLGILPDRAWLHKRIELRLEMMWADGFVPEVLGLIKKYPLTANMPSMRCVDYRQVVDYLLATNKIYVDDETGILRLNNDINVDFDPFLSHTKQKLQNKSGNEPLIIDDACQDMKNKALYATRQLAKRQTTWLRKLTMLGVDSAPYLPTIKDGKQAVAPVTMLSFDSIEKVKKLLI